MVADTETQKKEDVAEVAVEVAVVTEGRNLEKEVEKELVSKGSRTKKRWESRK